MPRCVLRKKFCTQCLKQLVVLHCLWVCDKNIFCHVAPGFKNSPEYKNAMTTVSPENMKHSYKQNYVYDVVVPHISII